MKTTRHSIYIGGRWVHYRRRGEGPVVVLLHGSPQSGAACAPLMEILAARGFCTIAPDNPGNGNSDPLPGHETDVAIYAHALKALFEKLGLRRIALYGFHTGAAHACAFAALYPETVSGAVFQGLPVWTTHERADILAHYLPEFAPRWDGSHLAWLWARIEEQAVFFPWHDRRSATRMTGFGGADTTVLHDNAMDLLRAGDAYRAPYESAFVFEGEKWAAQLGVPTLITAGPSDPLCVQIPRLQHLATNIETSIGATDRNAYLNEMTAFLARYPGEEAPQVIEGGVDLGGRTRGFVSIGDTALAFEGPQGAETLFLPDFGESIGKYGDSAHMTLDLPGHGEGGASWSETGADIADLTDQLAPFVRTFTRRRIQGAGVGGAIATLLGGESARAIEADNAPPDLSARSDGTHFLSAWRYLRKRALFQPWTSLNAQDARPGEPLLDEAHLQRQLIGLFLAGPHMLNAYRAGQAHLIKASAKGG